MRQQEASRGEPADQHISALLAQAAKDEDEAIRLRAESQRPVFYSGGLTGSWGF